MGDIIFNFEKLMMIFTLPNREHYHLVGDYDRGPKQAALYSMVRLISSGQPIDVLLLAFVECNREDSIVHPNITGMLEDYSNIFIEPTGLLPLCSHDHYIPLIPGASLTNIWPYRHPYIKKSEIKWLVCEM